MNKIRFLVKLPFFIVAQIFFIIAFPLFLVSTLFGTNDVLFETGLVFEGPKTFKEWMKKFLGMVFLPLSILK